MVDVNEVQCQNTATLEKNTNTLLIDICVRLPDTCHIGYVSDIKSGNAVAEVYVTITRRTDIVCLQVINYCFSRVGFENGDSFKSVKIYFTHDNSVQTIPIK